MPDFDMNFDEKTFCMDYDYGRYIVRMLYTIDVHKLLKN